MRPYHLTLGFLLSFSACAALHVHSPPSKSYCRSSEQLQHIRYRIDPSFTDNENSELRYAMFLWSDATNQRATWVEAPDGSPEDLFFHHVDSRPNLPGVAQPNVKAVGCCWKDAIFIVGPELDDDMFLAIAVHEVGHYLGLAHSPGPPSPLTCMTEYVSADCLGVWVDAPKISIVDRLQFAEVHNEWPQDWP